VAYKGMVKWEDTFDGDTQEDMYLANHDDPEKLMILLFRQANGAEVTKIEITRMK
jgi:hypothetical protein